MWTSREGVLTARVDPGSCAGCVVYVVRTAFGSETSFPVEREVGVGWDRRHRGPRWGIWKWKGVGGW